MARDRRAEESSLVARESLLELIDTIDAIVVILDAEGKIRYTNQVVEEITGCHTKGQPVLVGTISIEKSELIAGRGSGVRSWSCSFRGLLLHCGLNSSSWLGLGVLPVVFQKW